MTPAEVEQAIRHRFLHTDMAFEVEPQGSGLLIRWQNGLERMKRSGVVQSYLCAADTPLEEIISDLSEEIERRTLA